MAGCSRCEVLPQIIEGARDYYLWFPLGHSAGKVHRALEGSGMAWRSDDATGALVLAADPAGFKRVGADLVARLSSEEVHATRVVTTAPDARPSPRDYPNVVNLAQALAFQDSSWLLNALARDDLAVDFLPLVFADAPDEIYAHQASVEAGDGAGQRVAGSRLLQLAEDAGLLFQADRMARIAAIRAAEAQRIDTPIFVDFSPASIYDPVFCLRTTVAALEATRIPKDAVCFTIVAPERWDATDHLRTILEFYRGSGFRVALGGVGSGTSSLSLIETLKPDTMFIDRHIVASVDTDSYKQVIARKLLEIAQRLRIESVVSGVATEAELNWAYEQGANYVQGPYVTARVAGNLVAAA